MEWSKESRPRETKSPLENHQSQNNIPNDERSLFESEFSTKTFPSLTEKETGALKQRSIKWFKKSSKSEFYIKTAYFSVEEHHSIRDKTCPYWTYKVVNTVVRTCYIDSNLMFCFVDNTYELDRMELVIQAIRKLVNVNFILRSKLSKESLQSHTLCIERYMTCDCTHILFDGFFQEPPTRQEERKESSS